MSHHHHRCFWRLSPPHQAILWRVNIWVKVGNCEKSVKLINFYQSHRFMCRDMQTMENITNMPPSPQHRHTDTQTKFIRRRHFGWGWSSSSSSLSPVCTSPWLNQWCPKLSTSNATEFTWQQHKTDIGLIPREIHSRIYHEINFHPRQQRKSFWQPGKYMLLLSISMERSRVRICAMYDVNNIFDDNSALINSTYRLGINLRLPSLRKNKWEGDCQVETFWRDVWARKSHEIWTARYVVETITGKSL